MLDLIMTVAREDQRVRAVVLNGSRANPDAPLDQWMDYDVIYFVTETLTFRQSGWIDRFGERMVMQTPEGWNGVAPGAQDKFVYLMQFTDGTRIDLTLYPIAKLDELEHDSQTILLMDKDGLLPAFPPPDDASTRPQPPTQGEFGQCSNEFWWVILYVAKGLWRGEITYARAMAEIVHQQMMRMLIWYTGVSTDFKVNPGKEGKYLRRYLTPALWELLLETYAGADPRQNWRALSAMMALFRATAWPVADRYGYRYPEQDERRVRLYICETNATLGLPDLEAHQPLMAP